MAEKHTHRILTMGGYMITRYMGSCKNLHEVNAEYQNVDGKVVCVQRNVAALNENTDEGAKVDTVTTSGKSKSGKLIKI